MKHSKFVLADNPMLEFHRGGQYIIHLRDPLIVAQVFHFDSDEEEQSMELKRQSTTCATLDYGDEYIVLPAIFIAPTTIDANRLAGIMRRMADWYESYLIWEDKNISENES